MFSWVYVILSTLFSVVGQLTLKAAMRRLANERHSAGKNLLLRIAFSPWVIIGLAIYSFGVVFWLVALSHMEVSFIYPFASLTYVGIILGSYYLFCEDISRQRIAGVAIIILGVVLIGFSGNAQ
jgi:multidrug transporter EmrE-like cation transporter